MSDSLSQLVKAHQEKRTELKKNNGNLLFKILLFIFYCRTDS